jgi:hypothetical protein
LLNQQDRRRTPRREVSYGRRQLFDDDGRKAFGRLIHEKNGRVGTGRQEAASVLALVQTALVAVGYVTTRLIARQALQQSTL